MATITRVVTETVHEEPQIHFPLAAAKKSAVAAAAATPAWANWLVSVDHRLSMQLLAMPSLGRFEYAISLPGSMFGIPLFSLVLLPYVIAGFAEGLSTVEGTAPAIAATVVTLAIAFWTACIVESVSNPAANEATGVVRAFAPLGKKLGTLVTLGAPHISVLVVGQSSPKAQSAACFYIAVFYITQTVVEFLKTVSRRIRPVCKLSAELKGVQRQIPQIQHFLSREHAARSSFPSGDAAGATTFAMVGYTLTPPEYRLIMLPFWLFFPILSTFARVYFQAHFASDVLAGHVTAMVIAAGFLSHYTDEEISTFSWGTMFFWEIITIITWAGCQQLKPKTAEAIYNIDNLVGSFKLKSAKSKSKAN